MTSQGSSTVFQKHTFFVVKHLRPPSPNCPRPVCSQQCNYNTWRLSGTSGAIRAPWKWSSWVLFWVTTNKSHPIFIRSPTRTLRNFSHGYILLSTQPYEKETNASKSAPVLRHKAHDHVSPVSKQPSLVNALNLPQEKNARHSLRRPCCLFPYDVGCRRQPSVWLRWRHWQVSCQCSSSVELHK